MSSMAEARNAGTLPRPEWSPGQVIGGVDTHKHVHVAAACDGLGAVLGTKQFRTTVAGYRQLWRYLAGFGELAAVGIEGTGSWGSGLARWLIERGVRVVEVDRPDRQARRRRGKSDPIDAHEAARAVVSGRARGLPKAGTGSVEMIRMLRVARRSAIKQHNQSLLQLQSLADNAPEPLRGRLRKLQYKQLVVAAARFHITSPTRSVQAARFSLACLARRIQALEAETARLDTELDRLVGLAAPGLLDHHGVGTDTAGALLVAAGDNPDRLRSERSFVRMCGACPVPASSGNTNRRRLNRGGNREANSALWRIVVVRMATDPRTKTYVERRTKEGKSTRDIIRCLKRYVAREVYNELARPQQVVSP